MSNRTQAILILQTACDVLTERLIDRVVELKKEIATDADGDTYLSEIEELYDQFGSKLQHISVMLGQLPQEPQEPEAPDYAKPMIVDPTMAVPEYADLFIDFAAHIHTGDVQTVGHSLSRLFDIDEQRGVKCAQFFLDAVNRDIEFITKAMSLRKELIAGNMNNSLILLYECFGLQPYESISVVQTLKAIA